MTKRVLRRKTRGRKKTIKNGSKKRPPTTRKPRVNRKHMRKLSNKQKSLRLRKKSLIALVRDGRAAAEELSLIHI